jgi:CRISPR-associated protein Cas5d
MAYGTMLHVWGDYACFTRPEMKAERVSYDVITPSAARGLLEAIYWKPAIRWVVDEITILNPIVFDAVRRNELGGKVPPRNIAQAMKGNKIDLHQYITEDRQQRATLLLRDVAYIIKAHFEIVEEVAGPGDTPEKHFNIALRRMRQGQCFHQPYFGCREFPAFFRLLEEGDNIPESCYRNETEKDLGWMLKDIDYENAYTPQFFRATMKRGVVEVVK